MTFPKRNTQISEKKEVQLKQNETKKSELYKNLTFKTRNSDQKNGSFSLQNQKN